MVEGFYPESLEEAVQLKFDNKEAYLYAGGTDWMVRHAPCNKVLFLNKITELKEVKEDDTFIYIGSGCTYMELLQNTIIPEILKKAMRGIAAPAIRNIGTIGGNICNASPAGDTLPVLYALEATVVLAEHNGERILPIRDFILGIRKLDLKNTEILKQIQIPKKNFSSEYYQKVGARKSQALSKLSFTALATVKENVLTDLRIAFGSVSVTTVKIKELEEKYIGLKIEDFKNKIEEIKADYEAFIKPIDDQRSTAIYRKKVCINLLEDFIKSL
jgi:xanthine dehydrogenase FAD-binding subunit